MMTDDKIDYRISLNDADRTWRNNHLAKIETGRIIRYY